MSGGPIEVVEREFGELASTWAPSTLDARVLRLILHLSGETVVKAVP